MEKITISQLEVDKGNINLVAKIKQKKDVKEFTKFNKVNKVCQFLIEDATGEVILAVFGDMVDILCEGNEVELKNCFCKEYNGAKQITVGKFGKIEVIG